MIGIITDAGSCGTLLGLALRASLYSPTYLFRLPRITRIYTDSLTLEIGEHRWGRIITDAGSCGTLLGSRCALHFGSPTDITDLHGFFAAWDWRPRIEADYHGCWFLRNVAWLALRAALYSPTYLFRLPRITQIYTDIPCRLSMLPRIDRDLHRCWFLRNSVWAGAARFAVFSHISF